MESSVKSLKIISPLLLVSSIFAAMPISAEIIDVANNIANTASGGGSRTIDSTHWFGQAFTTPAPIFNSITAINLSLTNIDSNGDFSVSIYDVDTLNGDKPNNNVADAVTFQAVSTIGTGPNGYTSVNMLPLTTLSPSTVYYLVVKQVSGTGGFAWNFAGDATGIGFPSNFSAFTGSSWSAPTTTNPQKMQIQADIPEPGSLALLTIGIVGARFSRRKVVG